MRRIVCDLAQLYRDGRGHRPDGIKEAVRHSRGVSRAIKTVIVSPMARPIPNIQDAAIPETAAGIFTL